MSMEQKEKQSIADVMASVDSELTHGNLDPSRQRKALGSGVSSLLSLGTPKALETAKILQDRELDPYPKDTKPTDILLGTTEAKGIRSHRWGLPGADNIAGNEDDVVHRIQTVNIPKPQTEESQLLSEENIVRGNYETRINKFGLAGPDKKIGTEDDIVRDVKSISISKDQPDFSGLDKRNQALEDEARKNLEKYRVAYNNAKGDFDAVTSDVSEADISEALSFVRSKPELSNALTMNDAVVEEVMKSFDTGIREKFFLARNYTRTKGSVLGAERVLKGHRTKDAPQGYRVDENGAVVAIAPNKEEARVPFAKMKAPAGRDRASVIASHKKSAEKRAQQGSTQEDAVTQADFDDAVAELVKKGWEAEDAKKYLTDNGVKVK